MFRSLKKAFSRNAFAVHGDYDDCKKRGDAYMARGELDAAEECFRRACSIDPKRIGARIGLGVALRERKQFGEAERILKDALSAGPDEPDCADAYYVLGTVASAQGRQAEAIEHLFKAIERKPTFEAPYQDLCLALFQSRRIEDAIGIARKGISNFPDSARLQTYLGNLLAFEQDHGAAAACYERALAIGPPSADVHFNLGVVLGKLGRPEKALASYREAIALSPTMADAYLNIGNILQRQGRPEEALSHYQRVIALTPDCAAAHLGAGIVFQAQDKLENAIAAYQRAIEIDPNHPQAHRGLGDAFQEKGDTEKAIACFRQVLRLEPESEVVHLITALTGVESEKAPAAYVEKLFDHYAQKFDSHLTRELRYVIPEQMVRLLERCADPADRNWDALDLGCGTGLVGSAIAPRVRSLVGIDLSAKMLAKARTGGRYSRLEQGDLCAIMEREQPSSFDVVTAADVFVYVGKLDAIVSEASRLLRPGGLFAFSVESLDALEVGIQGRDDRTDYRLNRTGRYAHSARYLRNLAAAHHFQVIELGGTQGRIDDGKPVHGYLTLWRRDDGRTVAPELHQQ